MAGRQAIADPGNRSRPGRRLLVHTAAAGALVAVLVGLPWGEPGAPLCPAQALAQEGQNAGPLLRTHPFHVPGREPGGDEPETPSPERRPGIPRDCVVPGHPNRLPDFEFREDLSEACTEGNFTEGMRHAVTAIFDYGGTQAQYGVANWQFNLHDPQGLAEEGMSYFFYQGPDGDCTVYERENDPNNPLTCY